MVERGTGLVVLLDFGLTKVIPETLRVAFAANRRTRLLAEERVREQRGELAAQEQLASYLFHELRNDQNAQAGVFDVVAAAPGAEPLGVDVRELVAEGQAHAAHAARVIRNMLDFTKLRAGKLTLDVKSFELRALLDGCVLLVRHLARTRPRVALEVDAPAAVGGALWLLGASEMLEQVLLNLLTNAIKYTESGFVRLQAQALQCNRDGLMPPRGGDAQTCTLRFTVEDSGSGISPDSVSRIFAPFEQGYQPGTGLGLPLCTGLVRLMGGSLELDSPPAGGAAFSFCATLGRVDAAAAARRPAECRRSMLTCSKITVSRAECAVGRCCACTGLGCPPR